jgi:A/G-specific adenine glycosylase
LTQKLYLMANKKADFTKELLKWHKKGNKRPMPWKGEKNPYKIWLSEIILQQTRVGQGWAYYEKFLEAFPTLHHLAAAPEQKVFKLWEGLGYYTRCRNLIATAKKIDSAYGGKFPSTYEEIRELKGVGPYTAAAIASFAFNLPYAVVDGNVIRVLSRYFGIAVQAATAAGKKLYAELAQSLLDPGRAASYNQAIMDFGATICRPQNPLCEVCVQHRDCQAFQNGWVARLPVKAKSILKKRRFLYYFMIETPDEKIYIRKRAGKDIWEDLYEFVCWETDQPVYAEEILRSEFARSLFGKQSLTVRYISRIYTQELSHQTIQGQFIQVCVRKPLPALNGYLRVDKRNINEYAFPKFINAWLQDPSPVQNLF